MLPLALPLGSRISLYVPVWESVIGSMNVGAVANDWGPRTTASKGSLSVSVPEETVTPFR